MLGVSFSIGNNFLLPRRCSKSPLTVESLHLLSVSTCHQLTYQSVWQVVFFKGACLHQVVQDTSELPITTLLWFKSNGPLAHGFGVCWWLGWRKRQISPHSFRFSLPLPDETIENKPSTCTCSTYTGMVIWSVKRFFLEFSSYFSCFLYDIVPTSSASRPPTGSSFYLQLAPINPHSILKNKISQSSSPLAR